MNILFRKLIRDIKEAKGQFISIFIVVTLGVMFYSGINGTFRNLSIAKDEYYKEYRFADIWADVYKAPESIVKRVKSLPFVKAAEGRIIKDTSMDIAGESATVRLITLPDKKKDIVNDIAMQSGSYFSAEDINQCILEDGFLKANGFKIGDYIYPIINGNKVKMKIIGSARSPEFVYPLKDGSELMVDYTKFGIIYIKESFGQAIFGLDGSVNNISLLLKDGYDVEDAKDEIEKALRTYGVSNVIDRDGQISNSMLKTEIEGLKSSGSAFPVLFFIIASAIIYIMMGRMIENQRKQIGVLKAFGFTDMQILSHYLSYSIIVAVFGSLAGSVLGMYLSDALTKLENMYFNLPLADMRIYGDLAIPSSLMVLFFCLLAGYNSCKTVFKIMPGEAMRPKAPKAGKKVFLEKIDFLWNRISDIWKMIIRNMLRYKRRSLMISMGVVFSMILLMIAFGMMDTINFMVEQQYKNIQNYDIKVSFSKLLNMDEINTIRNIPHIVKMEPVLETGVEISNGWRKKDVGFTALIRDPEIYRVTDDKGNALKLPEKGIMIPQKLADSLGLKKYDRAYIKPYFPEKEKRQVPIAGIAAQYIGLNVYSSMDSVNYIFGEGTMANAAVLKLDDDAFEEYVKDKLKDMPAVNSVQSKSDSLNALMKNMGVMASSMGIFIVLAAVLSIAVLYNITTINIFERQRELATLKVLGFKDSEIKRLIFYENYLITIIGIVIALPFGKWLGEYIMSMTDTDAYSFQFILKFKTYVLSIVLTFVFTVITNFVLMRKIKSIDMVETLKSGE